MGQNFDGHPSPAQRYATKAQCLASYFGDPGKFSMGVVQASAGKKLLGKNHGKNPRTWKFDAKHSAAV